MDTFLTLVKGCARLDRISSDGTRSQLEIRRCIQKFPDRLGNEIRLPLVLLVEKQRKGLWRQNSLD
jgi:hypothetical protein